MQYEYQGFWLEQWRNDCTLWQRGKTQMVLLGVLPLLNKLVCRVMLIPMLFRLDLYTANHASITKHIMPASIMSM